MAEASTNSFFPYDVTSDGQRFIINTSIPGESSLPTVILDWTAMLQNGRTDR